MTTLVIVESPSKCEKIQSFLGPGYTVLASMGHIRALVPDIASVGIEKDFEPCYEIIDAKKPTVTRLQAAARAASHVLLATDDDREGRSISWHLIAVLKLPIATTKCALFHEITKPAILAAVANPQPLDMNMVMAQQARAMLDLMLGYSISPLLWGIGKALSAGRCQTPALRLLCDKEASVTSHKAATSFKFTATCLDAKHQVGGFRVSLVTPPGFDTHAAATAFVTEAGRHARPQTADKVTAATATESRSEPPPPFITSTLQQAASSRLGINPAQAMRVAQKLYESGHITYMRTDSTVLSEEAQRAIATWVTRVHGGAYSTVRSWAPTTTMPKPVASKAKVKKGAAPAAAAAPPPQAAHEAIRPTHLDVPILDGDVDYQERRLYALIWRRAVQSQMTPSRATVRRVTITTTAPPATWSTSWERMDFPGWRVLDDATSTAVDDDDDAAPAGPGTFASRAAEFTKYEHLVVGSPVTLTGVAATETPAAPPSRYTEASLVKDLETRGIGRPSTFANILDTLITKGYAVRETRAGVPTAIRSILLDAFPGVPRQTTAIREVGTQTNKLFPTDLGRRVVAFLVPKFTDIFDYGYTAAMEAQLDGVEKGTTEWKAVLRTAWADLEPRIAACKGATKDAAAARKASEAATGIEADTDRKCVLAPGIKVVIIKSGQARFVVEQADDEGGKPVVQWLNLPPGKTFETATLEDAEAAIAAAAETAAVIATGVSALGSYNGHAIVLSKGKFGWYVKAGPVTASVPNDDITAEEAQATIAKKATAYQRDVGEGVSIRQGPYGMYIMGPAAKTGGKPVLRNLPAGKDADAVTLAECLVELGKPPAARRGRGRGRGRRD